MLNKKNIKNYTVNNVYKFKPVRITHYGVDCVGATGRSPMEIMQVANFEIM